ncbi:hypothetical protein [Aeromonas hydrophila]|uniref:hypothetical protein n=1 Tax=Aeromonas hydrophila TaxID=644 RepID=UPI002B478899|nr:hypothetical protein [Aeromonas hydrophila]
MSKSFINQLSMHRGHQMIIIMMTISFWRLLIVGGGLIEFKELADATPSITNAGPFIFINASFIFVAAIVCASWISRSIRRLILLRKGLVSINAISVSPRELIDCIKLLIFCFVFTALLYTVPSDFIKTTLHINTDSTSSLMNGILVVEAMLAMIGSLFVLKRQVNIQGENDEK